MLDYVEWLIVHVRIIGNFCRGWKIFLHCSRKSIGTKIKRRDGPRNSSGNILEGLQGSWLLLWYGKLCLHAYFPLLNQMYKLRAKLYNVLYNVKPQRCNCFPVHVSEVNIPGFIPIQEKVNFMFKAYYFSKSELYV